MQQTISETTAYNPVIFDAEFKEADNEEPKHIKWTKDEYHYMAELGLFEGKRTEFLEGDIIEMPTMNSPHATALTLIDEALRDIFSKGFAVRNQMPLNFGKDFETVPDVVVIKGKARDFKDSHPQTADLVVEVSDTTLRYDRNRKAGLYARFGIQDYWIVNIKDKRLEVHRRPMKDENTFYGFSYADISIYTKNDSAAPLAKPESEIKVADILP